MDLFDRFLEERTYLKGVSTDTLRWYRGVRRAFAEIVAQPTKDGMMACVQTLLVRGVSPMSVNTYLRGFRAYLRWLHEEGHIKEIFTVPMLKAEQKVIETLTPEQVNQILRHSPKGKNEQRIHTFICVCLDTGLRLSETLSLTKDNIDFDSLGNCRSSFRMEFLPRLAQTMPALCPKRELQVAHTSRHRFATT